jgi:hypothetical protein
MEERQRKQMEYQQMLKVQIEEKKAKEDAIKKKKMEDDYKEEIRIKEEI